MLHRPPPDRRRRKTADRAERKRAASARQKRSRARRRRGRALLRVEVDEFDLIEALQASGRLDDAGGLDRARVEQEAGRVLRDWTTRWLPGGHT
jgi:hypothetical protein